MNIRPNQAAILCCLGLFAGSSLPIDSSVDERGGILSAVIKPLSDDPEGGGRPERGE